MAFISIDLGGTKLAYAIVSHKGDILENNTACIGRKKGDEIAQLIQSVVNNYLAIAQSRKYSIDAIGISVPGIYYEKTGCVWAPNLPGWENYPLLKKIKSVAGKRPVNIQNDRACYIMGEHWKGAAKNCEDVVFIAVGTGIGAGILSGGRLLNGHSGIAGAAGWMVTGLPYQKEFKKYGSLESYASGGGIARVAKKIADNSTTYSGILKANKRITAKEVFEAYRQKDEVACKVLSQCVELWGLMVANFVSLLNPEKIIFGGGVFGPAASLVPDIQREAARWAQPVSMKQVAIVCSDLKSHAGLIGAAFFAKESLLKTIQR